MFITFFTATHHCFLTSARLIESITPKPVFLRYILILSSDLHLCLLNGPFSYDFSIKILNILPFSHVRTTSLTHLILDLIIWIIFGKEYKLESPHYAVFSSLLIILSLSGANILLNTMFTSENKWIQNFNRKPGRKCRLTHSWVDDVKIILEK
jgi:hypothetical protein